MMYSNEQVKRIDAIREIIHSSEKKEISLCQYNKLSCVRCCLPHIGGDSSQGLPPNKLEEIQNKDKQKWFREFENQYVGPNGTKLKFISIHPRVEPKIEVSHYENSFQDVGKDEMEKRFKKRRNVFLGKYDPNNAHKTLEEYITSIKKEEKYSYKENNNTGFFTLFFGGDIPVKKNNLPECHLLANIGDRVGCLGHPLAPESKGVDGRELVGFFKETDSCRRASCEWTKEFQYLSNSALKVFQKATKGMSWYEYSRHSTIVMVAYLRAYDFLFEMMDKQGKLDNQPLDKLFEFTNKLSDNWEFKSPKHTYKSTEKDWIIPKHYAPGRIVATRKNTDILVGTFEEYNKYKEMKDAYWESKEKKEEDRDAYYNLRKAITKQMDYTIVSTQEGYKFIFDKNHEVHIDLNGNKPRFRKEESEFLRRIGYNTYKNMTELRSGKEDIISHLDHAISNKNKDAYLLDIPIKEKLLYIGLGTHFPTQWQKQLPLMRQTIAKQIEKL